MDPGEFHSLLRSEWAVMIPWLFSLSVDVRSWVFPVNIYTWIKSSFTFLILSESSFNRWKSRWIFKECHGLLLHITPSAALQVTFYLPSHVATTFPGKSRSFVAHRKGVCCRPGHVYIPSTLSTFIVIEFRFLLEVRGFLLHIAPCVVVTGSPLHLSINTRSPLGVADYPRR